MEKSDLDNIKNEYSIFNVKTLLLGATNARGVGRERRGNLRGGCMSKLCVE